MGVLALSQSAMAIVVPDGDFEAIVLDGPYGPGEGWDYVNDVTSAWTNMTIGEGTAWIADNDSFVDAIAFYPGAGHSGTMWVDMNYSYIHQMLTDTYVEGTAYELAIWATTDRDGERLYLRFTDTEYTGWDGPGVLGGSGDIDLPIAGPAHTWSQYSFVYVATAADAGKPIGISIFGEYYTWIDDVTLEIYTLPVIGTHPQDQLIDDAGTAIFSVSGANITAYEWYVSTDTTNDFNFDTPLADGTFGSLTISGANTDTLTLTGATLAAGDEAYYYCVGTGSATDDTSNTARLMTKREVAYWALEEGSGTTAADSATVSNIYALYPGTLTGGLDFTADAVAGQVGTGALSLDGVDDYISVPAMDLNTNTMTVTAWIKPANDADDFDGIVVCRDTTQFGFHIVNSGTAANELRYMWNGGYWATVTDLNVANGFWSFVALIIEPAKVTVYLNGIAFVDDTVTHDSLSFNTATLIGSDGGAGRFLDGDIDDVKIYNYSRTVEQLHATYYDQNGNVAFCPENDPLDVSGPIPGVPDCYVDGYDAVVFASDWLNCTRYPVAAGCP